MHLVVVSHACVTDVNQQVYEEMERLGHQVDLIVPSNFIAPGLTNKPIKVKRWPGFNGKIIEIPIFFNNSIPLHFYKKRLKNIFKESKPDAVYIAEEPYSISCYQSIKSALPFTKAVGFYSAQNIKKNYPIVFKEMEKYVYNNSSLAISISKDVTNVLREKGYTSEICEIPLGVDDEHFIISRSLKRIARKELKIPEDAFVIGFAGRIVEEKGVDLLLRSFKKLMTLSSNLYVLIVGRGPLLNKMRSLTVDLEIKDNVRFVDDATHTDMPKWFNCMDVHVLPSKTMPNWREQFGRVLVEAAACGVTSIGSSSGEIPNVLKSMDMNNIFREGNVNELSNEILKLRSYSTIPSMIREKAISQYGNKGIASKLITAFEKVI